MLVLKYIYKGERKEVPFDLSVMSNIEEPSEIDEWDFLNVVASQIKGEQVELCADMSATPRGGKRNLEPQIGEVAYEFGFESLYLIDAEDGARPIVFVV